MKKKIVKKVIKKVEKKIKVDVQCDVCGADLKEVGTNLFSINGDCEHYPNL